MVNTSSLNTLISIGLQLCVLKCSSDFLCVQVQISCVVFIVVCNLNVFNQIAGLFDLYVEE
jgi:hypothetical protein